MTLFLLIAHILGASDLPPPPPHVIRIWWAAVFVVVSRFRFNHTKCLLFIIMNSGKHIALPSHRINHACTAQNSLTICFFSCIWSVFIIIGLSCYFLSSKWWSHACHMGFHILWWWYTNGIVLFMPDSSFRASLKIRRWQCMESNG